MKKYEKPSMNFDKKILKTGIVTVLIIIMPGALAL